MFVRSIDPRTEKLVKEIACSDISDVANALERARTAQREWAARSKEDRLKIMRNAEISFSREMEELVDIIVSEGGFPRKDSLSAYKSAMRGFLYYEKKYLAMSGIDYPLDPKVWIDTDAHIELVPHGVIGHIGIWNFPFWQTMITTIPALMTGNAIVFKPSEYTTLTGLRIAEILHEAGVPENVFIPLIGGADIGRAMVRSDFDMMVFTGSISTGFDIMHNSGVKPLILELSGNDPAIICADADIDQAVRGVAQGTFSHGGQVCIRIKRVYVVESIAQKFIARLLELVGRVDVREEIGPLIREDARKKVQITVDKAITAGAELLCGGRSLEGPGFYFMPTVLLVREGMNVRFDEEIFGPVCPIIIVKDENEALIRANDSKYGLGGTIWTKDAAKGQELAMKMESGTIWINECGRTLTCGDYFQGWKSSGIASASDRLNLFMKKKAIIQHCSSSPREHWMK
jgi:acyl-CoA reductase-like NAD-dependent aldehyde dehydrogenase